jgi:CO/xanthine dehydrogenase Mo-binding subunit
MPKAAYHKTCVLTCRLKAKQSAPALPIDVSYIDRPDQLLDPLGARGTGAAIADAVFHATGKRICELPITPDKLL